ncbi:MAG: MFS transporter [Pseudomonadota bacterium]|mgnify:CR=1 FL=1|nr:MFS transporter [Pseudomonadota bacterium]MEC9190643.1 MFS transporter [Pseudomonadota bacterium]
MTNNTSFINHSFFYFFYFSTLGAFLPYWPLYLKSIDFSAYEIGFISAIMIGTKIIAPNIWGWLADFSGKRHTVIQIGSLFCFLIFFFVFFIEKFFAMAITFFLFSFFWNASLPQYEAVTMNSLGKNYNKYSNIRLWGSLGFIFTVLSLSYLTKLFSIEIVPYSIFILLIITWIITLNINKSLSTANIFRSSDMNIWKVISIPAVMGLLVSCFLMQISHAPFYTFFAIFLQENGYTVFQVGALWSLGVVAEVIVFLKVSKWIPLFGVKKLFVICFIFASIRWLLVASYPENIYLVSLSQIFHSFTYGMYHATAIYLIHEYFSGKLQGRGQAIYSSLSFGLGGSVGSYISGLFWDNVGGSTIFLFASFFAFLGFIVALIFVKSPQVEYLDK